MKSNEASPSIPPLKSLNESAADRPCILVDTREQTPLVFSRLPSMAGTLQSGDYSVFGCEDLFAVERKSIADLVACCVGDNRERFERELHRLRGFRFARLLIVGGRNEVESHQYRSRLTPKAVFSTLAAFEARYLPVVWASDADSAARLVETWAYWFSREIVNTANALLKSSEKAASATQFCSLTIGRTATAATELPSQEKEIR